MRHGWCARRGPGLRCAALLLLLGCAPPAPPGPVPPGHVGGVVFLDRDADGRRDARERGIPNVAVSNGRDVVRTDADGHYALPVGDDTIVFVVQPRGHRVPVDADGVPRFYRIHKPAGSPAGLRFPGVAPTGPLPSRIDFGLTPSPVGDRFSILVFGDPQVRDFRDLEYLTRDVVAPLVGERAAFGITLGDLAFDDLDLLEPLSRSLGRIGVPWWSVIGNHDLNFRAASDRYSAETWQRVFGPPHYAFQVGRVHFVVLDNVVYAGWNAASEAPGRYAAGLGDAQLQFVERYLEGVPHDELVVVALHIPLVLPESASEVDGDAERLLALLSRHPHTLSLSAHAHRQFRIFLGAEQGFGGQEAHHHLNVGATAGSWWLGALDENGIPHATMRDGTPNGYWRLHFEGADYRIEFRAARRPASHQINLSAPARVEARAAAGTEVLANVFAGSARTEVALRVGAQDWRPMQRVARRDPLYAALHRREGTEPGERGRPLPPPVLSSHLWAATLPPDLRPGAHVMTVRAVDPHAGVLEAHHLLTVLDGPNAPGSQRR